MSSSCAAKIKTKHTVLTPIVYPPDESSSNAPSRIVVSPYACNSGSSTGMNNHNNNSNSNYGTTLANGKKCWTPRVEFWWRVLFCFSVVGLFVCVGVLIYELGIKNKKAELYLESAWEHFAAAGHKRRSHQDPLTFSGFQRAEMLRNNHVELRTVGKELYESKVNLANVYEEHIWRFHTIFVSVAAFRDVLCPVTVEDIFVAATNPRRIFLGIIEQNEHGDPTCIPDKVKSDCISKQHQDNVNYFFCLVDNVRRRRVPAAKGRGPTFGRYVSMLMYRGESFYMMIDSHNRFKPGWDSDVTKMLFLADSPKPVLSHYPLAWTKDTNFAKPQYVTVMCRSHFVSFGYVRMGGLNFVNSRKPRLQPFTAAGFLFADAAVIHEVPFDPHLDFLFDGEELLYSARLYTSGWDSFAPSWNVVFHAYDRHTAPRFWHIATNQWGLHQARSVKRVQWILKVPKKGSSTDLYVPDSDATPDIRIESDKFGLGSERSLESFWKFANVDLVKKIDTDGVCGTYYWSKHNSRYSK